MTRVRRFRDEHSRVLFTATLALTSSYRAINVRYCVLTRPEALTCFWSSKETDAWTCTRLFKSFHLWNWYCVTSQLFAVGAQICCATRLGDSARDGRNSLFASQAHAVNHHCGFHAPLACDPTLLLHSTSQMIRKASSLLAGPVSLLLHTAAILRQHELE